MENYCMTYEGKTLSEICEEYLREQMQEHEPNAPAQEMQM